MTRKLLALTSVHFFLWLWPPALGSEELSAQSLGQIWRDAPAVSQDTELDRLNRAFVRLANDARSAIAQIRVATLFDPSATLSSP